MQIVRLMCAGRIDLAFIFRAFQKGADGVFIGGCRPDEKLYKKSGLTKEQIALIESRVRPMEVGNE